MLIFNERFLSELTYFRRPIQEFVSSYAYRGEFLQLLYDYFHLNKKKNISLQEILKKETYSFLKPDDKAIVFNYFSMIGKADSVAQKNYFTSMKETLKLAEAEAIKNNKKYGELYVKLGFLIGLLIVILII